MSPSLPPLGVLAGALLLLVVQSAGAADCTYRKDSLGNTRYQCDDAIAAPCARTVSATSGIRKAAPPGAKTLSAMCAAAKAPLTAKIV